MKKAAILLLGLFAGCSSNGSSSTSENLPEKPKPSDAEGIVHTYLSAAIRADETKTEANESHRMAEQDMDAAVDRLKTLAESEEGKAAILTEIDNHVDEWKMAVDDTKSRVNTLRVVGRRLTPEEEDWMKNEAPQKIEKLEFRIGVLVELKKKVGL